MKAGRSAARRRSKSRSRETPAVSDLEANETLSPAAGSPPPRQHRPPRHPLPAYRDSGGPFLCYSSDAAKLFRKMPVYDCAAVSRLASHGAEKFDLAPPPRHAGLGQMGQMGHIFPFPLLHARARGPING